MEPVARPGKLLAATRLPRSVSAFQRKLPSFKPISKWPVAGRVQYRQHVDAVA